MRDGGKKEVCPCAQFGNGKIFADNIDPFRAGWEKFQREDDRHIAVRLQR